MISISSRPDTSDISQNDCITNKVSHKTLKFDFLSTTLQIIEGWFDLGFVRNWSAIIQNVKFSLSLSESGGIVQWDRTNQKGILSLNWTKVYWKIVIWFLPQIEMHLDVFEIKAITETFSKTQGHFSKLMKFHEGSSFVSRDSKVKWTRKFFGIKVSKWPKVQIFLSKPLNYINAIYLQMVSWQLFSCGMC